MAKLSAGIADIYAAGWRVRTGLALASALPWPEADRRPADVRFDEAWLDWGLAEAVVDRGAILIAADGTAMVQFAGVGRFLVTPERVTCDLDVAADDPVVAPVVFGNVLATLCWRRRQVPLHAAAVAIDGRAVILAGALGVGKSVLAAALARRGHAVLADEVAVLAGAACLPLGGPLQLAADALAAFGVDRSALPAYSVWQPRKHHWPAGPPPQPRPYPVAAMVWLRRAAADAAVTAKRLEGEEAIDIVLDQTYWRDMLGVLDSRVWARDEAARLVAAASVWEVALPHDLSRIDAAADLIERLAGAAAA